MRYIAMLIFMVPTMGTFAQDKLHFKSGEVVNAKVIKVTGKTVSYYKTANIKGPEYEVSRNKLDKIVYENGETDLFSGSKRMEQSALIEDFGKNIVTTNYLDWLFRKVTFSYERILGKEGHLGVKGSWSIGFQDNSFSNNHTLWGTELEFHYYPIGQRRFTYYLSPMFTFGEARVNTYEWFFDEQYQVWRNQYRRQNSVYYGGYLGHGFRFSPTRHFDTSLMFAIGVRKISKSSPLDLDGLVQANIGYRF